MRLGEPSLIFFTSMVLIVGLVARTFREANSYATPAMLLEALETIAATTKTILSGCQSADVGQPLEACAA